MPDHDWAAAVRAGDLEMLQTIIRLVTEHEQMSGRTMTPTELLDALTGRLRRDL